MIREVRDEEAKGNGNLAVSADRVQPINRQLSSQEFTNVLKRRMANAQS